MESSCPCWVVRAAFNVRFPLMIGLVGTYKMTAEQVKVAIPAALEAGYRLFDTATIYKNEEAVGQALNEELTKRGLSRADIFVTSKLQTLDQGYENAQAAIDRSLERLKLGYIDMYLIHWPGASGMEPTDPRNRQARQGSWRALEEALVAGKLRAIGVSNYLENHIREMREYAHTLPMVNQIELHPLYVPDATITACHQMGVHVQAYSSLGRGKLIEDSFLAHHQEVIQMANAHGKSPSQVYLRWALQHGFSILPKSVTPERIRSNSEVFDFSLTDREMGYLDRLHRTEEQKVCWDPKIVV